MGGGGHRHPMRTPPRYALVQFYQIPPLKKSTYFHILETRFCLGKHLDEVLLWETGGLTDICEQSRLKPSWAHFVLCSYILSLFV